MLEIVTTVKAMVEWLAELANTLEDPGSYFHQDANLFSFIFTRMQDFLNS